jgi:hypothetical protein
MGSRGRRNPSSGGVTVAALVVGLVAQDGEEEERSGEGSEERETCGGGAERNPEWLGTEEEGFCRGRRRRRKIGDAER